MILGSLDRLKLSAERMNICESCDRYNDITTQCKECGCFMKVKTLMQSAKCPINKWGPYREKKEEIDG